MRWFNWRKKAKERAELQRRLEQRLGERRILREFLWAPKSFGGEETRWLEWAYVLYEVRIVRKLSRHTPAVFREAKWVPVGFVDDPSVIREEFTELHRTIGPIKVSLKKEMPGQIAIDSEEVSE